MSTISKEQLRESAREKVNGLEYALKHPGAFADTRAELEEELALARIALASLEAEPVSVFKIDHESSLIKHVKKVVSETNAPPAPVSVPDFGALTKCIVQRLVDYGAADDDAIARAEEFVYNACRDAMLQGAAGNSPVIPDGSEDTKRLDWLEAQNKRLNEYYGTTYGWKFDANFQRNAMMLNDSNYPVMTVRQAIDEAIAAAPQQEVKS
ncbi:hypothetical protein LMJ45_14210 [Enterobacter cloacae]|uniref:hypothetical protein n=1 Tax=Enterobacter cloacae TaxID=550 RepID=UPI001E55CBF2|nr:hypothetical protein [Enterobacter cloacae]UER82178.1 hypothetical protein LMJ45_14210 [Enterobacter cloacae]